MELWLTELRQRLKSLLEPPWFTKRPERADAATADWLVAEGVVSYGNCANTDRLQQTEVATDRGLYLLSVPRAPQHAPLSQVGGAGRRTDAFALLTDDGQFISEHLPALDRRVRVLHSVVMPDYAMALVRVNEPMPTGLPDALADWVSRVNEERGTLLSYNCKVMPMADEQRTPAVVRYVQEAAWREMVRQQHPEYFSRVMYLTVKGERFRAIGNFLLLCSPFKQAVIFHRSDLPIQRLQRHQMLGHLLDRGGVVVGAFISPDERRVRDAAIDSGGAMILITTAALPTPDDAPQASAVSSACEPIPDYGEDNNAIPKAVQQILTPELLQMLREHRLLLVSVAPADKSLKVSREQCLRMNRLAADLASRTW